MTLTRCPACQTVFRVRPEQLLARRGNVRCGRCYASFNALDHLIDDPPADHGTADESDASPRPSTPPPVASPLEPPLAPPWRVPRRPQPPTQGIRFRVAPSRRFALEDPPGDGPQTAEAPPFDIPATESQPAPAFEPAQAGSADFSPTRDFELSDALLPAAAEAQGEPAGPSGAPEKTPPPGIRQHERHGPDDDVYRKPHPREQEESGDAATDRRNRERNPEDSRATAFADRLASKLAEHGKDDGSAGRSLDTSGAAAAADVAPGVTESAAAPGPEAARGASTPDSSTLSAPDPDRETPRPEPPAGHEDPFALPPRRRRRAPGRSNSLIEAAGNSPRTRALLGLAAGILLGALTVQTAYLFRAEITQDWPALRPAYLALCEHFGCDVPLPRAAREITIESSTLQSDPVQPAHFVLTASVRNRAPYPQTHPHLELTLTDRHDRPLVRRVIEPAEWAGARAGRDAETGFRAGAKVEFELPFTTKDVDATGYRLYVFYP